jgi:hypothetical protein
VINDDSSLVVSDIYALDDCRLKVTAAVVLHERVAYAHRSHQVSFSEEYAESLQHVRSGHTPPAVLFADKLQRFHPKKH